MEEKSDKQSRNTSEFEQSELINDCGSEDEMTQAKNIFVENFRRHSEKVNIKMFFANHLNIRQLSTVSKFKMKPHDILPKEDLKKNKITETFENMLGSKLIISKDSNMLILKPHFCTDILVHLKSSISVNLKLEIIDKLFWLINKIHTNAFILTNKSLYKESKSQPAVQFMNELIDLLIGNDKEFNLVEALLNFIERVIYLSGLKRKYFKHALERLSEYFSEGQYDGNKFVLILKLLKRMLIKTIHDGENFPEKYFFFNNAMSELRVNSDILQQKNISLQKGFTVCMWIRIEQISPDASNKKIIDSSCLFYIYTSKFISFEVHLKNKSLYYRVNVDKSAQCAEVELGENNNNILTSPTRETKHSGGGISFTMLSSTSSRSLLNQNNNNYNNSNNNVSMTSSNSSMQHIAEIEFNKWTMLVFTHKPSSFLHKPEMILYKDNDPPVIRNIEFPNMKNQKVLSIGFFKDFTGQASHICMLNEGLTSPGIANELFSHRFGLYNERNIRMFNDFLEESSRTQNEIKQMFDSMIFMYSPCRVRNGLCKDLIDNIDAELTTLTEGTILSGGVAYDNNYYINLSFLGGINVFLPIFEFIFSNHYAKPVDLEEALNILCTVIDKRDVYQKNLKDSKFFSYLAQILEQYEKPQNITNCLFSMEILNKFCTLGDILTGNEINTNNSFTKDYFKCIVFNPKIFTKFDVMLQIELWKKISQLYAKKITILCTVFDAKDIFEMIIKVYDNDINCYCCEDHLKMLCERNNNSSCYSSNQIVTGDASPSVRQMVSDPNLMGRIEYLLAIVENLLTNNKILGIDQLMQIIPLLSYEISPCLQKGFLLILAKLFVISSPEMSFTMIDETVRFKYISEFIQNKGIEHLLYISTISTLDVKFECLKLFDMLCKYSISIKSFPFNIEDEYIPFIVHSLFPVRTPLVNNNIINMNNISATGSYTSSSRNVIMHQDYFDSKEETEKIVCGTLIRKKKSEENQENLPVTRENVKEMHDKETPSERNINSNNGNCTPTNRRETEIMNDIMNLNLNLSPEELNILNPIPKSSGNYTTAFRKYKTNLQENSLYMLEEEYWKMISNGSLIKNLSIPDLYVKEYSNPLNDQYVEKIYDYLIKWLVRRYKSEKTSSLEDPLQLDDSDTIEFEPALNIIMKVIMYGSIISKQKCLTDFYMLTVYNKVNCHIMIRNKYFYQWLLDLIVTYQILLMNENFRESKQSGIAVTIIELGIKIHTSVIINSILYEQEGGGNYLMNMSVLGSDEKSRVSSFTFSNRNSGSSTINIGRFDHVLIFQFLLTWMYKIRKIGIIEGKAATVLVRTLLIKLIDNFRDPLRRMSSNYKYPLWHNFLSLTLICYEFAVYSNYDKKIFDSQINFDMIEKNEILCEIVQNLNYDFSKSETGNKKAGGVNNINNNNINDIQTMPTPIIDIWQDKELLIKIYESFSSIWHDSLYTFPIEKKTSSDEIKSIESTIHKIIFDSPSNNSIEDLKLLLYSSTTDNIGFEHVRTNNILRSLLNIIMIIIRLSENKSDISTWVKELEKFVLFVISACENSRVNVSNTHSPVSESFLTYAQETTCQIIVLVFNFLLEELNSPRRRLISDEIIEEFRLSLRNIFIFFTLTIDTISCHIESTNKQSASFVFSYLNNIKNAFLIRTSYPIQLFSPCWKAYTEFFLTQNKAKIFETPDIKDFYHHKFTEIPEKFSTDSWIYAFQDNNNVFKIIKSQFNFNYFEKLIKSRIYEADNIILNNDICFMEKSFVTKVYKKISSAIKESLTFYENKLLMEIYNYTVNTRMIEYEWKGMKKEMYQWRGKWTNLQNFLVMEQKKRIKFKIANHLTSSISRPILFSIYDTWDYLPNFSKYSGIGLFIEDEEEESNDVSSNDYFFRDNHITRVKQKSYEVSSTDEDILSGSPGKNMNTDNNTNSNIGLNNCIELRIKQSTNKSHMYYANPEFSDFIEKYTDLEKLIQHFHLFYTTRYENVIMNITDYFVTNLVRSAPQTNVFDVCIVKLTGHKAGKLLVNSHDIIFIRYLPSRVLKKHIEVDIRTIDDDKQASPTVEASGKCVGALFEEEEKEGQKLILAIKIANVKQIYKRRYYYKKTALEIFTFGNKSYYVNFSTQNERDSFCKVVYDYIVQGTSAGEIPENVFLFEYYLDAKKNNLILSHMSEEWTNWRMSNFDLLMNLNNLGGRSYHDLTQYPIFPWIISDYTSSKLSMDSTLNIKNLQFPNFIRDLSKPIGALGSEERMEMFRSRFNESENPDIQGILNEGRYFYNSHYSNPFYTTHFLQRIFPYTACGIELQGEGFDKPSRQFFSIPGTFQSCMTNGTDVRELVPEFFFLPEMFLNLNNFNFGMIDPLDAKTRIGDTELPPWAATAFHFVMKNRMWLESEYVSYKIHEWIDLIFGYKQKGKEGEQAMNLFWKCTYEDEIDIDEVFQSNQENYQAHISKVDFGQTPYQIYHKPHIQRISKDLTKNKNIFLEKCKQLKAYNSTSESLNSHSYKSTRWDIINKMIIQIKALENNRIMCVMNNGIVQIMKADDTPYSLSRFLLIKEKERVIRYNDCKGDDDTLTQHRKIGQGFSSRQIMEEDDDIMKEITLNQPVRIIKNGKFIIKGGFYDGKFLIYCTLDEKCLFIQTDDDSKVTFITTDEMDKTLFVGTSSGRMYLYDIIAESKGIHHILSPRQVPLLTDHDSQINYIYVCNRLNVVATVANDKTCNLYTYPHMKLFRVIKNINNPTYHYDYVFLSINPLPSVILYSKSEQSFFIYSINGGIISQVKDEVKYLFTPLLISDNFQRDHLIYGTQDGCIYIRPLPLLEQSWKIELQKSNDTLESLPIKCLEVSKDKRSIYYWQLDDYNISVIKYPKDIRQRDSDGNGVNLFDRSFNN